MPTRRYTYRAYPSGEQRHALSRVFGCCRLVFNDFIAERERLYKEGRHREIEFSETARRVTTLAKRTSERAFLAQVSSVALQQSVADARAAYRNLLSSASGKRKGRKMQRPRFKKRGSRQSARFTKNSRFCLLDTGTSKWGKVCVPGAGALKFRRSRHLPSEPSSVTVILEPSGRYFVSFVVEVPETVSTEDAPEKAVALDAGIGDALAHVVRSDGSRERVDNPRHLRRAQRKLRREQKALSRKQPGSNNWAKQRRKVAGVHRKMKDTRLDHHRKVAKRIVASGSRVGIEDLSLSGMGRTKLAKSVYDAGIGLLFRLIEEEAENQGRSVYKAGRWEPMSQTCAVCGVAGGKKPLSVRVWTCSGCGTVLDRDYNAATNVMLFSLDQEQIVTAGPAVTINACGGDVRLRLASADPGEAGTLRT